MIMALHGTINGPGVSGMILASLLLDIIGGRFSFGVALSVLKGLK
jgi:hypothetical protein